MPFIGKRPSSMTYNQYCTNCDRPNPESRPFCDNCGIFVGEQSAYPLAEVTLDPFSPTVSEPMSEVYTVDSVDRVFIGYATARRPQEVLYIAYHD